MAANVPSADRHHAHACSRSCTRTHSRIYACTLVHTYECPHGIDFAGGILSVPGSAMAFAGLGVPEERWEAPLMRILMGHGSSYVTNECGAMWSDFPDVEELPFRGQQVRKHARTHARAHDRPPAQMHIRMHARMHARQPVRPPARTNAQTHACTHACVSHARTHTHVHACAHTRTHARRATQAQASMCAQTRATGEGHDGYDAISVRRVGGGYRVALHWRRRQRCALWWLRTQRQDQRSRPKTRRELAGLVCCMCAACCMNAVYVHVC